MYFAAFLKNAYFFSILYIGPIPIFLDVLKNKNGFQVHLGSRFVIIKILHSHITKFEIYGTGGEHTVRTSISCFSGLENIKGLDAL